MAKSKNTGSVRKITRTRNGKTYTYWEARVTTGINAGTGKQIQRSFTGKTRSEVVQKLQETSVEVVNGLYIEPSKITVAQWLQVWLDEYCINLKYGTRKSYKAISDNHIVPALGAIKLGKLRAPEIQAFYNSLAAAGKSAKTIRNINGVMTAALNRALALDYIKINPIIGRVTVPNVIRGINSKDIKPLSDAEIRLFLKAVEDDQDYCDILKVILFLGLREAEAIGLTWDCIDFKAGTVKIYRQWQKRPLKDGGSCFAPLKNNKQRTIKASDYVLNILRNVRSRQKVIKAQFGAIWDGVSNQYPFVFTGLDGKPVHCKTLFDHYKKIVSGIGCPERTIHDLRHTFAVLSLQNGDDVKTVQQNLGHATASFTLDVYGHVSERMQEESAKRMQKFIEEVI